LAFVWLCSLGNFKSKGLTGFGLGLEWFASWVKWLISAVYWVCPPCFSTLFLAAAHAEGNALFGLAVLTAWGAGLPSPVSRFVGFRARDELATLSMEGTRCSTIDSKRTSSSHHQSARGTCPDRSLTIYLGLRPDLVIPSLKQSINHFWSSVKTAFLSPNTEAIRRQWYIG
jgi:hypothetical protein